MKKGAALGLVSHASKTGRSFFQETNRSVRHRTTHFYNSHQEPSFPDKPSLCALWAAASADLQHLMNPKGSVAGGERGQEG